MADVVLKKINKIYDNHTQAVIDFDLEIKDHEFIVIVGPSGCGKSTTLRMIAGLENITTGELYIDGKICNSIAPKDRNIAMVFQSYALFPHMSVYENMAYGLNTHKISKKEIKRRVYEAASILELEPYLNRKPKALSGGQCQRVALGRAIVHHAKVFLMDEPLSNLDAQLRVQMRSEIIKLHERINATTIYVTHDQTEAMTMADRIVVMKDGQIQQIGTPKEIYHQPANMFVGGFLGAPAMNFLSCIIQDKTCCVDGMKWKLPEILFKKLKSYEGKEVILGIRPEDISHNPIELGVNFVMNVEVAELLGSEFLLHGTFGKNQLIAKIPASMEVKAHMDIKLYANLSKMHFFDKETTNIIL